MKKESKYSCLPASEVPFALVPLFDEGVPAGFPSPAEDHLDLDLDLGSYLIDNPTSTFCVRVEGNSMIGAGIHSGDVIMVDRSREPVSGSIVLAVLDGEFTVKRVDLRKDKLFLVPENPLNSSIEIVEESSFQVWGVVTFVIHKL